MGLFASANELISRRFARSEHAILPSVFMLGRVVLVPALV